MHKRIFNYLSEHNLLYQKQFGFQEGHSTEHAMTQFTNPLNEKIENNCFTLVIFIDLFKRFGTVNQILNSILKNYGVKGKKLVQKLSQKS